MPLSRRHFSLGLAAACLPPRLRAGTPPHVVVVGAGVGGLCFIAGLRRRLPAGAVRLSLVEPRPHYTPPFGTPRVLAGRITAQELARPYPDGLPASWQRAAVTAIDRRAARLQLSDGRTLGYDYLVLAPGLQAAETLPGQAHLAWFNDDSMRELMTRLNALPERAQIVMTVPPQPYRCPPAPYERAGLIVEHLARQGRRDVHLVILDAKESFSLQAHYLSFWENRWPGRIEWLPPGIHDGIREIHADGVVTGLDTFRADLLLAIPRQRAPVFCTEAGVGDFTGYCPVTLPGFRSHRDEHIYVIGDAAKAGAMPKSASAARGQAACAAADLAARLGHRAADADCELRSRCFSRLDHRRAISSDSRFDAQGRRLNETLSPYPLQQEQAVTEFAAAETAWRELLTAMGLPPGA